MNARFFSLTQELTENAAVILSEDDSRHFVKVLRGKVGDTVTLCDGNGLECVGEVVGLSPLVTLCATELQRVPPEPTIRCFVCVSKGERFEWTLQKLCEVGVSEITPVVSSRCVAGAPSESRFRRWQKILLESSKQCCRAYLPVLRDCVEFSAAIGQKSAGLNVFCYENERNAMLQNVLFCGILNEVSLFTGAEGGFSDDEAALAARSGWSVVSLGRRILRCETAPVVAASALQYCVASGSPN